MAEDKNPVGRPRKWKTVEELDQAIQKYFDDCKELDDDGNQIGWKRPLTITGLAIAVDSCRDTLLDYQNHYDGEFSDTIKKAKQIVESYAEEYLFNGKNTAGAIFNLVNNYGWKNKSEQETTHRGNIVWHEEKTYIKGDGETNR